MEDFRQFIGGQPRHTKENDIIERFKSFGNISDIYIKEVRENDTTYGFLTLTCTKEILQRTISRQHKIRWNNSIFRVEIASNRRKNVLDDTNKEVVKEDTTEPIGKKYKIGVFSNPLLQDNTIDKTDTNQRNQQKEYFKEIKLQYKEEINKKKKNKQKILPLTHNDILKIQKETLSKLRIPRDNDKKSVYRSFKVETSYDPMYDFPDALQSTMIKNNNIDSTFSTLKPIVRMNDDSMYAIPTALTSSYVYDMDMDLIPQSSSDEHQTVLTEHNIDTNDFQIVPIRNVIDTDKFQVVPTEEDPNTDDYQIVPTEDNTNNKETVQYNLDDWSDIEDKLQNTTKTTTDIVQEDKTSYLNKNLTKKELKKYIDEKYNASSCKKDIKERKESIKKCKNILINDNKDIKSDNIEINRTTKETENINDEKAETNDLKYLFSTPSESDIRAMKQISNKNKKQLSGVLKKEIKQLKSDTKEVISTDEITESTKVQETFAFNFDTVDEDIKNTIPNNVQNSNKEMIDEEFKVPDNIIINYEERQNQYISIFMDSVSNDIEISKSAKMIDIFANSYTMKEFKDRYNKQVSKCRSSRKILLRMAKLSHSSYRS